MNGKPECKVHANGDKHWHLNGNLHREDGPAVEYANGIKYWYLNGELHREDGPATEFANGETRYWICLLYTSPSPRDLSTSRMPSSA